MNEKIDHIRKAVKNDIPLLAQVLARAFNKEPFSNWIVKQDERRTDRLQYLFNTALRANLQSGSVYTSDNCAAAAVWQMPKKKQSKKPSIFQTWDRIVKAGPTIWQALNVLIKSSGIGRIGGITKGLLLLDSKQPKKPYYYLFILGVDPSMQNKGVGSKLLQPVLQTCDETGIPAYLETTSEKNVQFYDRFGFKVNDSFHLPYDGPKMWTMFRHPLIN